jgi:hypothetical protein
MPPIAVEYLDKNKNHEINQEWKDYYILLEGIRISGITNMWGASPYLAELAGIPHKLAQDVLCSWIKNYSELKKLYWPDQRVYVNMSDIIGG